MKNTEIERSPKFLPYFMGNSATRRTPDDISDEGFKDINIDLQEEKKMQINRNKQHHKTAILLPKLALNKNCRMKDERKTDNFGASSKEDDSFHLFPPRRSSDDYNWIANDNKFSNMYASNLTNRRQLKKKLINVATTTNLNDSSTFKRSKDPTFESLVEIIDARLDKFKQNSNKPNSIVSKLKRKQENPYGVENFVTSIMESEGSACETLSFFRKKYFLFDIFNSKEMPATQITSGKSTFKTLRDESEDETLKVKHQRGRNQQLFLEPSINNEISSHWNDRKNSNTCPEKKIISKKLESKLLSKSESSLTIRKQKSSSRLHSSFPYVEKSISLSKMRNLKRKYNFESTLWISMTPDSEDLSIRADTEAVVSNSVFEDDIEDTGTIEHDIVATKYGLPYDIIDCSCSKKMTSKNSSLDCRSECSSRTCYNFEKRYGAIDDIALRRWCNVKRYSSFKVAAKCYESLTSKPDKDFERIFLKADRKMKKRFPHYWVHLFEKYTLSISDQLVENENIEKLKVIKTCKKVVNEQNTFSRHYKIKMKNSGDDLNFKKDKEKLDENFKKICEFLMGEYPTLFSHLMKGKFKEFVNERERVDRDRRKFVKMSDRPTMKLSWLEKKYSRKILTVKEH